jgi:hypothetical protein
MSKKYTKKELEDITKELRDEDKQRSQEILLRKIQSIIEQSVMPLDHRMRNIERNLELLVAKSQTSEELVFRSVGEEEAKREIENFVRKKPGSLTSDIVQELQIEPEIVIRILNQLNKEGKVRGESA